MSFLAVNDDMSVTFDGSFSSKRGLMRVANRAVRDRYADLGLDAPRQPSFDLFTGYSYTTSKSYSPITFDGDTVVIHNGHVDDPTTDMTEVEVALYLAAYGQGMYRVFRSCYEPSEGRYYVDTTRLNFWDGNAPATRAHELMGLCPEYPHIMGMQFISDRFAWCEGSSRVCVKSETIIRNGHTYSRRWWDEHHSTCVCCGTEFATTGGETCFTYYEPGFDALSLGRLCPECTPTANVIYEETEGDYILADGLPSGFLSDFEGHVVYTRNLDRCGTCHTCGGVTTNIYHRGFHDYCASCAPHDMTRYHHTCAERSDFRCVDDTDHDRNLFLGIELETLDYAKQDREDWASTVKDLAECDDGHRDYVETKADCSLGDDGVEIVTMPATPDYHLSNPFWGDVFSYGEDRGVTEGDCCGLHIHINRDFFHDSYRRSDEQLTIDRIVSRFAKEWRIFSRRENFEYCRLRSDDELGIYPEDCPRRKRSIASEKMTSGHYTAVNHADQPTVELRFFRGTMDETTFRAAVEAAAGIAIVAKSLHNSGSIMEDWTWADMRDELANGLKAYGIPNDEFLAYCEEMGL